MRPYLTFHVMETLLNSSMGPICRNGVVLSNDDSRTTKEVYLQWLLLLIDLGYLPSESPLRVAQRLWADMLKVDVLLLNEAFAECLSLTRHQTSIGFKAQCSVISSHLYHLIKDDVQLMLSGDVGAGGRLIQVFSYTSRLTLHDIDLTQQQLEDYYRCEALINFDPDLDPLYHRLNSYIKEWMGSYMDEDFFPRHGEGGVAAHGRCSLEVKYKDLTTDPLLEYAFGTPHWVSSPIRSSLDRISQTIFVPKSYKSFRTISMEPTTLQYFQQGVWREIDRRVLRNSYLRNHIDFHDQSRNRRFAQLGSEFRWYATLDLSAASDSVGYDLVKRLFKGTWLLRYIVATRSHSTLLPDGRLLRLRKFAPMGSSLCFPIETLIFASIAEHVTRISGSPGDYSVFGDDIVVPTHCAEMMIKYLTLLGFRVNTSKSFYQETCWFRESCGGEYLDGVDVTPMRISRKYDTSEQQPHVQKLIDLANTAYNHGYRNLRHFFLAKIRSLGYIALFSPQHLLGDSFSNYHSKKRWNRHLQRFETQATHFAVRYSKKKLLSQDESIRYRHWLESTALRQRPDDGFQSVICTSTTVATRAWFDHPAATLDQCCAMIAK